MNNCGVSYFLILTLLLGVYFGISLYAFIKNINYTSLPNEKIATITSIISNTIKNDKFKYKIICYKFVDTLVDECVYDIELDKYYIIGDQLKFTKCLNTTFIGFIDTTISYDLLQWTCYSVVGLNILPVILCGIFFLSFLIFSCELCFCHQVRSSVCNCDNCDCNECCYDCNNCCNNCGDMYCREIYCCNCCTCCAFCNTFSDGTCKKCNHMHVETNVCNKPINRPKKCSVCSHLPHKLKCGDLLLCPQCKHQHQKQCQHITKTTGNVPYQEQYNSPVYKTHKILKKLTKTKKVIKQITKIGSKTEYKTVTKTKQSRRNITKTRLVTKSRQEYKKEAVQKSEYSSYSGGTRYYIDYVDVPYNVDYQVEESYPDTELFDEQFTAQEPYQVAISYTANEEVDEPYEVNEEVDEPTTEIDHYEIKYRTKYTPVVNEYCNCVNRYNAICECKHCDYIYCDCNKTQDKNSTTTGIQNNK